jgi:hypothetical protein
MIGFLIHDIMCHYEDFCWVLGVVAFVPSEGGSGEKIGSKNSC